MTCINNNENQQNIASNISETVWKVQYHEYIFIYYINFISYNSDTS